MLRSNPGPRSVSLHPSSASCTPTRPAPDRAGASGGALQMVPARMDRGACFSGRRVAAPPTGMDLPDIGRKSGPPPRAPTHLPVTGPPGSLDSDDESDTGGWHADSKRGPGPASPAASYSPPLDENESEDEDEDEDGAADGESKGSQGRFIYACKNASVRRPRSAASSLATHTPVRTGRGCERAPRS